MIDDDQHGGSDPCIAHRLVDGRPVDPGTVRDVARFRTAERVRLIEARRRIPPFERAEVTTKLINTINTVVVPQQGMRIAVYWPIRGEPDLRKWMALAHVAGASVLLPVVIQKNSPLVFCLWSPKCAMGRGVWNILVPADGIEMVPDVVISPLLGVDDACFRLGNGGGYYDRTLAQFDPLPRIAGVGFADCVIPTIFPMPWDVPMDCVVLSDGSVCHRS